VYILPNDPIVYPEKECRNGDVGDQIIKSIKHKIIYHS
jgi:hypothetical protein